MTLTGKGKLLQNKLQSGSDNSIIEMVSIRYKMRAFTVTWGQVWLQFNLKFEKLIDFVARLFTRG